MPVVSGFRHRDKLQSGEQRKLPVTEKAEHNSAGFLNEIHQESPHMNVEHQPAFIAPGCVNSMKTPY
jgi:hypothetical protein